MTVRYKNFSSNRLEDLSIGYPEGLGMQILSSYRLEDLSIGNPESLRMRIG